MHTSAPSGAQQATAMRRELDEALPVLREFFGRMQRAAASHNLHP
jgi:hypothetical protein